MYALRVQVHPGNSGGPLAGTDGKVLGMVFAASREDPDTGYALTAKQVADAAAAGRDEVDDVATGPAPDGQRTGGSIGAAAGRRRPKVSGARRSAAPDGQPTAASCSALACAAASLRRTKVSLVRSICALARSGPLTFFRRRLPMKASRAAITR